MLLQYISFVPTLGNPPNDNQNSCGLDKFKRAMSNMGTGRISLMYTIFICSTEGEQTKVISVKIMKINKNTPSSWYPSYNRVLN